MKSDRQTPLVLLIIGLGFVGYSTKYNIGNLNNPGVGFFPILIGVALAGLAGFFLVREWSPAPGQKGEAPSAPPILTGKAYGVVATLVAFAALHSILGYWTSIFGAMAALLRVAGVPSWKKSLLGGAITSAVSYLVFEYWLGVLFPEGWIR